MGPETCRLILPLLSAVLTASLFFPGPGLSQTGGGRIAFQKFADKNWDLWLVNADGTGNTVVVSDAACMFRHPVWAP